MLPFLPVWLNAILSIAALIVLAAGGFAYFKSSAGLRTLNLASEEIKLLNERDQRRSAEFQLCKEQLAAQANSITLLTDTVTGATAVKELAQLVQKNHEEVVKEHRELVRKLSARTQTRKRTN